MQNKPKDIKNAAFTQLMIISKWIKKNPFEGGAP
jgi:hypothetical protein